MAQTAKDKQQKMWPFYIVTGQAPAIDSVEVFTKKKQQNPSKILSLNWMVNPDNYKKNVIKEMLPYAIAFGLLSAYVLAFTVCIIAFPHAIGFAASSAFGATLIKAIFSFASALSVYGFYKASSPMFYAHREYADDTFHTEESRSKSNRL